MSAVIVPPWVTTREDWQWQPSISASLRIASLRTLACVSPVFFLRAFNISWSSVVNLIWNFCVLSGCFTVIVPYVSRHSPVLTFRLRGRVSVSSMSIPY